MILVTLFLEDPLSISDCYRLMMYIAVLHYILSVFHCCIGLLRSDWNKNNMTLGSQSYPAVGFTSEDLERLQAPVGRVWFAGEYISNEVGSVASAYISGKRTSKNILSCVKSNLCPILKQKC